MSKVRLPQMTNTPLLPSLRRLTDLAATPFQQRERWQACEEALEPLDATLDASPLLSEANIQSLTDDIGYGKRFQDPIDRQPDPLHEAALSSSTRVAKRTVRQTIPPPDAEGVSPLHARLAHSRHTPSPERLDSLLHKTLLEATLLRKAAVVLPARTGEGTGVSRFAKPSAHSPEPTRSATRTRSLSPTLEAAYHTPIGGRESTSIAPIVSQLLAAYGDSAARDAVHRGSSTPHPSAKTETLSSPSSESTIAQALTGSQRFPAGRTASVESDSAPLSRLNSLDPSHPKLEGLPGHLEQTLDRVQGRRKVAQGEAAALSSPVSSSQVDAESEAPRGLRGLAARLKAQTPGTQQTANGTAASTPGSDLEPVARTPAPPTRSEVPLPPAAGAVTARQAEAELSARLSRILRREAQRHGIDLGDS